ncbi:MAG: class II aldolase/adducin family protein [Gemmatimonadetes bacterium]|nr:class II aldolase/adducin family protein [Gemmatimonadota bacterium]
MRSRRQPDRRGPGSHHGDPHAHRVVQAEAGNRRSRARPSAYRHTATGFAVAGIDLKECILPEVVVNLGGIPLVSYGTPGGPGIVEPMVPLLRQNYYALLLANHGAVTLGADVMDAHFKMETVELCARIALVARQLGHTNTLDKDQVQALLDRYGAGGKPRGEMPADS